MRMKTNGKRIDDTGNVNTSAENRERKIGIPSDARTVLQMLNAAGFEAYVVGGFVRDSLLGNNPYDIDVTTSATPEETESVFGGFRVIETGIRHGTVTVIVNGRPIEITTFREDGEYGDHRHPKRVSFSKNLEDDLLRRDFTVNAMAADEYGNVIDCFGGIADLENGVIRAVGDPEKRFSEDALRILRALRFAAVLGFGIDGGTESAMTARKGDLRELSAERIMREISLTVTAEYADVVLRRYTDIFAAVIPELNEMRGFDQRNRHHIYDVLEHTLQALKLQERDPVLRFATLLHDVGKPRCFTVDEKGEGHFFGHGEVGAEIARDVMTRLKADSYTLETVTNLVRYHDYPLTSEKKIIKRRLNKFGEDFLLKLIKLKRADNGAKNPLYVERGLYELDEIERTFREIIADGECFTLKSLKINGHDLISMGLEGKEIGVMLERILYEVIDGKLENDRGEIIKFIEETKRKT